MHVYALLSSMVNLLQSLDDKFVICNKFVMSFVTTDCVSVLFLYRANIFIEILSEQVS